MIAGYGDVPQVLFRSLVLDGSLAALFREIPEGNIATPSYPFRRRRWWGAGGSCAAFGSQIDQRELYYPLCEAPARLGRPRGGAAGRGEFFISGEICFGHVGGRGIGVVPVLHVAEGAVVVIGDRGELAARAAPGGSVRCIPVVVAVPEVELVVRLLITESAVPRVHAPDI